MSPRDLDRGSIVTVAATGVYSGKPRQAVVVQARQWLQAHPSITLCPLTSTLVEAPLIRLAVAPSPSNGLTKPSQLMVDKLFTVPMTALGNEIGQLEPALLHALDQALRGWLGLISTRPRGGCSPNTLQGWYQQSPRTGTNPAAQPLGAERRWRGRGSSHCAVLLQE